MDTIKKKVITWNGKKYFLLGEGKDGYTYYLESFHFDCEWYWGGGYVVTFTNKNRPEKSKDFEMFTHFDTLFFNKSRASYIEYPEFFKKSTVSDKEMWEFLELMQSFYTARKYSDMICRGGSSYTSNPNSDIIKSDVEYKRINDEVIPAIINSVYKLLGGE